MTKKNKYNRYEYTALVKAWRQTPQTPKNFADLALMQRAIQRREIKAKQGLPFKVWVEQVRYNQARARFRI